MPTKLNPYLSFKDNAREAMQFYKSVFGGELYLDTYEKYLPEPDPKMNDKVMHASLQTPSGFTLMGSDTPDEMGYAPGSTISISLSGEDEAELRGYWEKLSAGAQVSIPLEKAPWGDTFGQLTDKFGTAWMVNITGQPV